MAINDTILPGHEPDDPSYFMESDIGHGRCPLCNSGLENCGAHSDGDGDLYDLIVCPCCGEYEGRANERWFATDGSEHDSFDDMNAWDHVLAEEESQR
jgi:hypothetical protein